MRHPPPTDADVSHHIALLRLRNMDSWKMVCRMHSLVSNSASAMENVPGVVSFVHMNLDEAGGFYRRVVCMAPSLPSPVQQTAVTRLAD